MGSHCSVDTREAKRCLGKISPPFSPSPSPPPAVAVWPQSCVRSLRVSPPSPLTSLSSSLCYFLCPRKCWTSARTEEAVKSLSTAVSLGPTSALAAANTLLSGTNADPVSLDILLLLHLRLCCPNFFHLQNIISKQCRVNNPRKSMLLVYSQSLWYN